MNSDELKADTDETKWCELRIENEKEVQDVFEGFFRTMGCQMGPTFSNEKFEKGGLCTTYPILKKFAEAMQEGDNLFHADVEPGLLWEIDFDRDVVVIPVKVKATPALLGAIKYFEDEKNRVVMDRSRNQA